MAHTNETPTLGLPQFVAEDKATFLGDFNQAFSRIDSNAASQNASIEGAVATAASASTNAAAARSEASQALETATSGAQDATQAINLATEALTVANNTATLATATNVKVGDLENLDTTEKGSIVAAINEVAANSYIDESEIIWENPNPSVAYVGQTDIPLNIPEGTAELEIICNFETAGYGEIRGYASRLTSGNSGDIIFSNCIIAAGNNSITWRYREAVVNWDTSVVRFTGGNHCAIAFSSAGVPQSGIAPAVDNTHMVPYRIIAHKHYGM